MCAELLIVPLRSRATVREQPQKPSPSAPASPQNVAVVARACDEVRSSSLMRHLLKLALEIGNFLNASSPQGAAVGFNLETLSKLRDVKSSSNPAQTLLHFIARQQMRQCPDESLAEQLAACAPASRLNWPKTMEDLRTMRAKLNELSAKLPPVEAAATATPFQVRWFCTVWVLALLLIVSLLHSVTGAPVDLV